MINKRTTLSLFFPPRFNLSPTNHHHYSTLVPKPDHNHQNLINLLQSCKHTPQTAQVHAFILKTGLDTIPFPMSKLLAHLSMQDINYAASIFKHVQSPTPYMYNTMLRGYSVSNDPRSGLYLFNFMWAQGILIDEFSLVAVLKSCSRSVGFWSGVGVHGIVVKCGFGLVLSVKNALLHFYGVCGRVLEAHQVFDELGVERDLVSWNSLMGGYVNLCQYDMVVALFRKLCSEGYGISVASILCVLQAIVERRNFVLGKCVHGLCVKVGFLSNLNVVTALVSIYGKNGCNELAFRVFDEVDVEKDVVLWNCLIDGYAKAGLLEKALELLRSMLKNGLQPNSSTLAGLLSACSSSRALAIGEYVYNYVEEQKMELDVVLGTALVHMYAKSGLLEKANNIFDRMECKDGRCWTTMISGYGLHGQANRAVKLYHRMEEGGSVPNEVTFLAVLNSCSHGGLVSEGMSCFKRMVEVYKLIPKIEHYGCLIDLLGRAGLLEEAYELIEGLPITVDATTWRALLGACRVYGNIDLAKHVLRELEEMHDEHPADSLSLTGTYAVAGMAPSDTSTLERANSFVNKVDFDQSGKKEAGWSMIEL